jgi:uncharacterized GH25 family protein
VKSRLLFITFLFAQTSVSAHDMWIDPVTFFPESGQVVGVRLRVGQDLIGDPLPRDARLINQFVVLDEGGRKPIGGREGGDPAGLLRTSAPGLMVIGYHSNPSVVELAADKFNQYLKEEGLDEAIELRARRKENGEKGRELFSRCAKSLLLSGPVQAGLADRALGLPIELVAERNPYALRAGQEFLFRLTYENRALPNALVVAINRQDPSGKLSARSDAEGRVRFRLPRTGMWLIKAVHMVPAPPGSGAEWASFWASLTFELRPTGANGH